MHEVITVQLGQAGNAIGYSFWEILCREHGIFPDGKQCKDKYFESLREDCFFSRYSCKGRCFIPRVVMADIDKKTLGDVKKRPFGNIFPKDVMVGGPCGYSGKTFGRGKYTEGLDLINIVLNRVRKEAERCDRVEAIQVVHGLGGGTGSGMSSLFLERARPEYPKQIFTTVSILPSREDADSIFQYYNSVLAVPELMSSSDITICIDNDAVRQAIVQSLPVENVKMKDLNHIISMVMAGISSVSRIPGSSGLCMKKIQKTLIPFKELHFFLPGYAPILLPPSCTQTPSEIYDPSCPIPEELINEIFDGRSMFSSHFDERVGKIITAGIFSRGPNSPFEIERLFSSQECGHSSQFVDWLPSCVKFSHSLCLPYGVYRNATLLANTTLMADIWREIHIKYRKLYDQNTYINWFYGEGVDKDDFEKGESKVNDLIELYSKAEKGFEGNEELSDEGDNVNKSSVESASSENTSKSEGSTSQEDKDDEDGGDKDKENEGDDEDGDADDEDDEDEDDADDDFDTKDGID